MRGPRQHGIALKKSFGQNFLKDPHTLDGIWPQVNLSDCSSVLEIGGGSGVLTREILAHGCARLWVFEIDPEWAAHLRRGIIDSRVTIFEHDILDFDFEQLRAHAPWTLVANLPYHITFPLFYRIQQYRELFAHGVVMVQEEVAQRIIATRGRDYGYVSLYLQRFFEWVPLDKIAPSAFVPAPKIYSRLLYFKPKIDLGPIKHEELFWKFIKRCFGQPRRTLKNNLSQGGYDISKLSPTMLGMRAQQLTMADLTALWQQVAPL